MAVQVVYRPSLQAPQSTGHALQALTQFGQAEQRRTEQKLQQQYKDRDTFAEMLKLDPVYASSVAAQKRVAGIMDEFVNDMTAMNKKRGGRTMSTQDLMEMQQKRGLAMAEMQYIQGANERIQRAASAMAANPSKYNERLFNDALRQWTTEGTLPDGPILVEAFKNPFQKWDQYAQRYRQGATWADMGDPYTTETGATAQMQQRLYPLAKDNAEENVVGNFLQGYEGANLVGFFSDNVYNDNPQEYQKYMEAAGGNLAQAAQMYFNENRSSLYPQAQRTEKTKPSVYSMNVGITYKDGAWWDRNQKMFGISENIPVEGETLDKAVVFVRKPAMQNLIPIPASALELQEGIQAKSGTVEARVHAANKDKTYVYIDKNSLDKVTFTDKFVDVLGVKKEDLEKVGENEWKIKEGVADDVMIPVDTEAVRGLIDNWTGEKFSEAISMLPDSGKKEKITW